MCMTAGQLQDLAKKCTDAYGFTADPHCDNCNGCGYFELPTADDPDGNPCAFCLEDAIKKGELDGTVDGVKYAGGSPCPASE